MESNGDFYVFGSPVSKHDLEDLRESINNIQNKNQQISSNIVSQLIQSPDKDKQRHKIDMSKSSSMISKDDILQKLQANNKEYVQDGQHKINNDMTVSQLNDKYIHIKNYQYSQCIIQQPNGESSAGQSHSLSTSLSTQPYSHINTKTMLDLTEEQKTFDVSQFENLMPNAKQIVSSILDEENGQNYFTTWFQLHKISRGKIIKYIQEQVAAVFIPRFISMCESLDASQELEARTQSQQNIRYKIIGVLLTQCQLAIIEALLIAIQK